MAKPEWGIKRMCTSCGARFYDLGREPIVCPACEATVEIVVSAKQRRSRPAPRIVVAPTVAVAAEEAPVAADDKVADDGDDEVEVKAAKSADDDSDDDDGESAIEDVSELGDDDVSDVIGADHDDDETER